MAQPITEAMVKAGAKAIWDESPRAFGWLPGETDDPDWDGVGDLGRDPFIQLSRACLEAAAKASPKP